MSDEFNNNEQSEINSSSNYPENDQEEKNFEQNRNSENYINPENTAENSVGPEIYQEENRSFNTSVGNEQSYYFNNQNQVNHQANYGNPYPVYPAPQMAEVKKPKKKRKIFGAFKLTAAALAFGIIAGAAFQGYYLVMDAAGYSVDKSGNNDYQISQVTENTEDGDTIVPAATTAGSATVTDVSDVVDKVMPSIVAINATVTATASDFFGRAVSQEAQSSGSGIIFSQNDTNLLIVTNNHVVEGATSVEIVFADESKVSADVKGSDANADLAVISVDLKDLSADTLKAIKVARFGDSGAVKAGDMAIAIGNALGYGQSVTVGYISAVDREVTIDANSMTLLQTDAAINPGNSGGALLNTAGEVIGINSVKYADTEVEGMGYAIPISSALPMIKELINRETVSTDQQGFLGIDASTAQNVTSEYADRFNMPVGIYVNDVIKNSPAEKAGLEPGDIITGVDDVTVQTIDDLVSALSYKKAGEEIALKTQVKENGAYVEKTLTITLGHK